MLHIDYLQDYINLFANTRHFPIVGCKLCFFIALKQTARRVTNSTRFFGVIQQVLQRDLTRDESMLFSREATRSLRTRRADDDEAEAAAACTCSGGAAASAFCDEEPRRAISSAKASAAATPALYMLKVLHNETV